MEKDREQEEKDQFDINRIHDSFVRNLESLRIFIYNLTPAVKEHDKTLIKEILDSSKKLFKIFEKLKSDPKNKKKTWHKLIIDTKEKRNKLLKALKVIPKLTPHNVELLYKSTFVMLISYFEFLFSDLIRYFYQKFPESLSGKELSITLIELKFCNDLSEAINYIVNREVDNVLYGNLESQKKYFKNYLKIDTNENIIHWNKLNEATERRNIIVHNDSIINRRYLKNMDLSVVPEKKKELKLGQKININEDYFKSVFNEILIAGVILIQCCWRKWKKEDIANADDCLIADIYDALLSEEWIVVERIGLFSKECKVYNDSNRLILDINYCQSLKWQNKKDELEQELKRFDISSLSPIYKLALCALKSDKDNFYKHAKKAIVTDDITKDDFMEWPLFRERRKDSYYEKRIKKAFESITRKSKE